MRPWSPEYAGRLDEREIASTALAANALGDPATRPLWVYLPPAYDREATRRFPVIYLLQPFGAYLGRWNQRPGMFGSTTIELLDELFAGNAVPPTIVVFVDAWTSLGGSQFVDSPATGAYHSYLCDDVVTYVDDNYRTLAHRDHRALQGKSSGGFGAVITAMLRPDIFSAFASHAGDAVYEHCYLPELAVAYRALRDNYGRSYAAFFEDFAMRPPMSRRDDASLLLVYAVAACFSPNPDGTVDLPIDLATGALRDEVWSRWLSWDPVRMVAQHSDALCSLRGIWIDAGRSDDYLLDLGAEQLAGAIRDVGVSEIELQLFDGTHSGIDHRYPLGAAYLAARIAAD